MVFSGILFLVYFLPVFLLLVELIPNRWIKPLILVASVLFYEWGAPLFLFLLVTISIINFFLVKWMDRQDSEKKRKRALVISLVLNLGILFVYKYFNFFLGGYADLLNLFHAKIEASHFDIPLPIGVSFFTFESLTYIIDIYRREQKPLNSYWEYQLYIIYFPKLIAGPIVRYRDIADQLQPNIRRASYPEKIQGMFIFMVGLGKKVLIANMLAPVADRLATVEPNAQTAGSVWLCVIAYTFQIYFDFSGYSDMAIGLSKIIGINLRQNFNNPYAAYSVTEFWKRWHISMTSWFRNYLYIPLGGNRGSRFTTYRNLVLVFFLSGLWHGAKWSYVLWGLYHGFWLVMERVALLKLIRRIKWLYLPVTFFIVATGWLFFRVENIGHAFMLFRKMFFMDTFTASPRFTYFPVNHDFIVALVCAAVFSFAATSKKILQLQENIYTLQPGKIQSSLILVSCIAGYVLCLSFITSGNFNPFIYFRF